MTGPTYHQKDDRVFVNPTGANLAQQGLVSVSVTRLVSATVGV